MNNTYLKHHGIKGQKWGVRRYQNEDGSLTTAGQKRYTVNEDGSLQKKKMSTGKKVAIGVGVAAATGAAVVAAGTIIQSKKYKELKNAAKMADAYTDKLYKKYANTSGFKAKKLVDKEIMDSIGKSREAWSKVGKKYNESAFSQLKDKTIAQLSVYLLQGASVADRMTAKFSNPLTRANPFRR